MTERQGADVHPLRLTAAGMVQPACIVTEENLAVRGLAKLAKIISVHDRHRAGSVVAECCSAAHRAPIEHIVESAASTHGWRSRERSGYGRPCRAS